jgi:hypothetical protein
VAPVTLICSICGQIYKDDSSSLVMGVPIMHWWASKSRICKDCLAAGVTPPPSGRKRRDAGMAQVDMHTPAFWRYAADAGLHMLCDECILGLRINLTAEDLRVICGDPPNHPNAMSARIGAWRARGLIDRHQIGNSRRPSSHAASMFFYVPSAKYIALAKYLHPRP